MVAVSNSGPLIWLAKYKLLHILRRFYRKIIIPRAVFEEVVVKGKERGHKDALTVEGAISRKWIAIADVEDSFLTKVRAGEEITGVELSEAERQAIALAKKSRAEVFLTNDLEATVVSEHFGVKTKGILYLLVRSVKEGILTKGYALKAIRKMVQNGFWIDGETALAFEEELRRLV